MKTRSAKSCYKIVVGTTFACCKNDSHCEMKVVEATRTKEGPPNFIYS